MFEFDRKPQVDICGKMYDCDIADNGLITGVATDFPKILQLSAEFERLQGQCAAAVSDQDTATDMQRQVVEKNEELTATCQSFICGCLGEEEYSEIFAGRRPNSVEHIKLCTHLFGFIMGGREALVAQYRDPPEVCHVVDDPTLPNS